MVKTSLFLLLCLLLAGCALSGPKPSSASGGARAAATPSLVVGYSLEPIVEAGALRAVEVEMAFVGDPDGETILHLPGEFAGQAELWRHLTELQVSGAAVEQTDAATRILRHTPGASISVSYRVGTAYSEAPSAYAKGGAIIRPDWFASFGEALFSSVEGRERSPATFTWAHWPSGWKTISDLDHGRLGRTMTGDDIVESTLMAGPDVQVIERPVPNGTLRLGIHGAFDFGTGAYVDALTQVIAAQRAFWGDAEGPFTVTLYELKSLTKGSSVGGTGRSDGFALEATPDIDLAILTRILAHEHTHTWIPRKVGELPKVDEPLGYWFSEGVTDFYTGRTLLGTGVWTPAQFADDLNEALARYAGSPSHSLPNSAIAREFWTNDDVQQLPYDRGRLFALMIDGRLRNASDGVVDYDDLLKIMRERWRASPVEAKPDLRSAFIDAAIELGLDTKPLLARFIDDGEAILLPRDLFQGCAIVRTVELARFEPGFDRSASSDTGVIQGVIPNSPAARAGLRDGMRRIAYVSSKEGDSRVPMAYRIADADGERVISWLPAGKAMYVAQEVALSEAAGTPFCLKVFSGVSGS